MPKIVSSGRALHSSEFHERKKKVRRLHRALLSLGILIIILLPFFLLRLERFKVKEIKVLGTEVLSAEEIVGTVQEIIGANYLWLVPKSNALILPRDQIAKVLVEKFPRIKSLDENLTDSKTLEIKIEERQPYALYCKQTENFLEAADCFFLDDEGFIFAPAPSFSGEVFFIYSGLGFNDPLGKHFLEQEQFKSLSLFLKRIERFGIFPIAFGASLETEEQKGRDTLYLPDSGIIFWNAKDSLETIESSFNSFFSSDIVKEKEKFLNKILYMDLTVPNKVFYKFQNNE